MSLGDGGAAGRVPYGVVGRYRLRRGDPKGDVEPDATGSGAGSNVFSGLVNRIFVESIGDSAGVCGGTSLSEVELWATARLDQDIGALRDISASRPRGLPGGELKLRGRAARGVVSSSRLDS